MPPGSASRWWLHQSLARLAGQFRAAGAELVIRRGASLAELQKLPGVGKVQAQRIAAMRPFLSIQDLIRAGIPQKAINQLKPAPTAPAKK